jgi:hypothetical protein
MLKENKSMVAGLNVLEVLRLSSDSRVFVPLPLHNIRQTITFKITRSGGLIDLQGQNI